MASPKRSKRHLRAGVAFAFVLLMSGSLACASVVPGYRLHGGDQLSVEVFGEQTLTGPATVLPDGTITMPLIGRVHVGGQTPDEAAQTISHALQKYLKHPVVTVSVTQEGQLDVLVLGNVKNPGKYSVPPTGHLTDAIAAAGGLGPTDGPLPDARIGVAGGSVSQVSLEKLLHDGDTSADIPLQDGSVVYIPAPETISVEVLGAVDHPGQIALHEGDRLSMAIAMAGNSASANADLNHITVTRPMADGKSQVFHVNLYDKLEKGDLATDMELQKGDVVYVPQAYNQSNNSSGQKITAGVALLGLLKLLIP
jgi:polysaccharide export outer membrane protein